LYISPGVELQISAEESGMRPEQIRALLKEVMLATKRIMEKETSPK